VRGRRLPSPRGPRGGAAEPLDAAALRDAALRLLARREYGRAEIAQRLRARGGQPDDIAATLDALAADGYLSDERFADMLVQSRSGRFSTRAIAHELKERGVASDAAQAALERRGPTDDLAEAHALWERRFGAAPRDERDKARQVRFLMSRGFGMGIALRVLKLVAAAALAGSDDDAGDEA